ncbi:unnamed protein product [Effrenium voratum]|uniref:Methyltransferase FkbM domain-containing protein n=1 Tax=Effrenium voratum TaxID=2562239 RepID=A0AA36IKP6_9DINO|nr:unnamed protein product [Effrenium voratum]
MMGEIAKSTCVVSSLLAFVLGILVCQNQSRGLAWVAELQKIRADGTVTLAPSSPALVASEPSPPSAPPPSASAPPASPVAPLAPRGVKSRCLDDRCSQVSPRCRSDVFRSRDYRCPSDDWVKKMAEVDPNPDKVIMNVGCNKGHDSIAWLQMFDQEPTWDLKKWARSVPNGPCKVDSDLPRPPSFSSSKGPVAVCVEAAPQNVKLLKKVQKKFGYEPSASGGFHVVHAAVMDVARPGSTVSFPDAPAGQERAGLSYRDKSWKMTTVPAETVDTLALKFKFPKVDVLIIDTEGADPAVLDGAKETLKTVRYLLFEVHRDLKGSHWSKRTLLSVVQMLDSRGFDCWWAGVHGETASVTQCYEPRFEQILWSNVVCVKRDDVWWHVLESRDPNAKG